MSEPKDPSLPFFGGALFQTLTPEEAVALREKTAREKAEREALADEKIKLMPEGALSIDEKRALAYKLMAPALEIMSGDRIDAMTESELNTLIVAWNEFQEAVDESDAELEAAGYGQPVAKPKGPSQG